MFIIVLTHLVESDSETGTLTEVKSHIGRFDTSEEAFAYGKRYDGDDLVIEWSVKVLQYK